MPEKKPDPLSSLSCYEGGKRHIKGCPYEKPVMSSTWTMSYGRKDRTTFSKEEWIVEYIEALEGSIISLKRHRAVFALILVALAVISILKT